LYKIRSKITGWFSSGGVTPQFTKNGKMFPNMRAVNLHYNVVNTSGGRHSVNKELIKSTYMNCELVEYEITEVATHVIE